VAGFLYFFLFSGIFFQFELFMRDRETAAGAPFGGGGISFRGCGGKAPTGGLMGRGYRKHSCSWYFGKVSKHSERSEKFQIPFLQSCQARKNYSLK
jgi:hypothetical protein